MCICLASSLVASFEPICSSVQGTTLSNAKPKYRLLVSQSQSPFLIPATWLLSDLYPTSLYYCDRSHQHFHHPTRGSLGTTRMPVDVFSIVVWLLVHDLDYGLNLTVPVSSTISSVWSSVYHQSVGILLPYPPFHTIGN